MNFFQSFENLFPEVIGNLPAKLALILNLIEPRCGGILICGKKGTGKSLLLKCFKKLLNLKGLSYIEIPLGVTEEALLGGIDIEKTIEKGVRIYEKGLLEKGKGKFVLIDDLHLFPEEYLSFVFENSENFNLIATLNPEEGFISPHFLDRFGMGVVMENVKDIKKNLELLRLYENFYNFEELYLERYQTLLKYLEILKIFRGKIKIVESIWDKIVETVLKEFVISHRAEVFLFYTSLAYAIFRGELYLKESYVEEVAPLVLIHRKREIEEKQNFQREEEREKENKEEKPRSSQKSHNFENKERYGSQNISQKMFDLWSSASQEKIFDIGEIFKPKRFIFRKDKIVRKIIGRRTKSKTKLRGGRFLRSVIFGKDKDLDFFGTLRNAAPFQILRGRKDRVIIYKEDFRYKEKERKMGHLVIFLVDGSGSMGVQKRMEAVKGALFSLLMDCYQKRDKVSLIIFRKAQAEVVLPPTSSVELAYQKLKVLPTGGKTPLSLGLLETYNLIKKFHRKHPEARIILIVLSDGKANVALKPEKDPIEETRRICGEIKGLDYVDKIIVDCEVKNNFLSMELAKSLAEWLGGKYFLLEELKAENLKNLILQVKQIT